MALGRARSSIVGIAVAILLVACSSSASPSATPAGAGGGGSASAGPGTGEASPRGATGGGDVLSINACTLLTASEINTALGVAVKAQAPQNTDTQVECEWDSDDGTTGVSVSVAVYDDAVWQTLSKAQNAKPVSGLGDAAFSGVPHSGDVAIKTKGYEVDLGIVDFSPDTAKVDAATLSLAKLVLSRL